jgi:hypothetical protein
LLTCIAAVSAGEGYTDFRDALQAGSELLSKEDAGRRKVIVLLTDGIMECPPDTGGQNPIARGDIFNSILPNLRRQQAEVYTIGLSSDADESFLREAASLTSLASEEAHSFHVERAVDLTAAFTRLVQYWTDFVVLRTDRLVGGRTVRADIDRYVSEFRVVAVGDVSDLSVTGGSVVSGTVPLLRVFTLSGSQVSGTKAVTLPRGECSLLWVGRSTLLLEAVGLKPRYGLGEPVEIVATPRASTGTLQLSDARVDARLALPGGGSSTSTLIPEGRSFRLTYYPPDTGRYELRLVLTARDASGKDIFPRPSLTYQFEVMPDFYVVPKMLSFGSPRGGRTVTRDIEVHYGLPTSAQINMSGSVEWSSNRRWRQGNELPAIETTTFEAAPGAVSKQPVRLRLPGNAFWRSGGHYRGAIRVTAAGQTRDVEFWVHLETWWEFWRRMLVLVIILAALVVGYFVYVWGFLPTPAGVLVPVEAPGGEVLQKVRLGEVKRGLFLSWLSPRRNRVSIAARRADICYGRLPPGLGVELAFYRWPGTFVCYVRNSSIKIGTMIVTAGDPALMLCRIRPGSSLRLKHGSVLEFGGYKFRFESAR